MAVSHGEYKTIGQNAVFVHYTENEVWDDDGNVSHEPIDSYEYFFVSKDYVAIFFTPTCKFEKLVRYGETVNIEEN